ncbi:MAG: hypothetical protein FD170_2326 [Bacteroidetes bacterium]|nr:MAG: hypothetical protein FD170_2326 [Bacteroidota bacterium]
MFVKREQKNFRIAEVFDEFADISDSTHLFAIFFFRNSGNASL